MGLDLGVGDGMVQEEIGERNSSVISEEFYYNSLWKA